MQVSGCYHKLFIEFSAKPAMTQNFKHLRLYSNAMLKYVYTDVCNVALWRSRSNTRRVSASDRLCYLVRPEKVAMILLALEQPSPLDSAIVFTDWLIVHYPHPPACRHVGKVVSCSLIRACVCVNRGA